MASPRTSVEAPRSEAREPKEGLSAQTLIIAAASSAVAAILVSQVWEQGTILASAMTPVIVAIVSDLLKKPVQSERLRSGVRNVSSVSRPRSGRTPKVLAPPPRGLDDPAPDDGTQAGPVRVYSSGSNRRPAGLGGASPRRRLHLKVAVVTGLIAFLIAAAALTLPELVFGGSVGGGDRSTTYFGGGEESKERGESQDGDSRDGRPDEPTEQGDEPQQPDPEAPVAPGGDSGGAEPAPAPEQPTPPTPTTPPEAPTQPPPESGTQTSP